MGAPGDGVITKVFRARAAGPVLRAVYRAAEVEPVVPARLIASWDGWPERMEPPLDPVTGRASLAQLGGLLMQPVRACERAPELVVFHLALRNAPHDRRLSDEEWAQVCDAVVDRTGIAPADDLAGCRWVAVRAGDELVHLVATLAREDGREPKLWNSYYRLREVANDYEREFGLRPTGRGARSA